MGTLFFRVIHHRSVATVNTHVRIHANEWDAEQGCIRGERSKVLTPTVEKVKTRLEKIIAFLDREGGEYGVKDVTERFYDTNAVVGLISFARSLIRDCEAMGKQSAANHYRMAANRFEAFTGGDIPFANVDSSLICRFEALLRGEGLCPNTTSYYIRKLRAVYNMAVDRGYTPQANPFKHVYTGVAKTGKRAVPLTTLRKLKELDLPEGGCLSLARDMFLFSFYTRGMSMIDMAYLKKTDLKYGVLTYRRKKTGQQMNIKWEPAMQGIVDRYDDEKSKYLLPLIRRGGENERREYLTMSHLIYRSLRRIGERLGLERPLTMYVARHTWASVARERDVPVGVISEGMGHDSERTTRIYLASLDSSTLDMANRRLISLVARAPKSPKSPPAP